MATSGPDLSPVSVLTLVFTAALGPQLADAVGSYAVILVGWFAGLIWGTLRLPNGIMPLWAFTMLTFAVTFGLTVPAAEFLASNAALILPVGWKSAEARSLFFPIAMAIPAVGHSWPACVLWVWNHRPGRRS